MRIVRTQAYAKSVKRLAKLGARGAEIATMEDAIAANPRVGDLVPGTGGLRKMRFAFGASGKGAVAARSTTSLVRRRSS